MLITKKLQQFRKPHPRSIVAFGVFDGLHRGHQYLVRRLIARAVRSGANSVVLTFEPHPRLVLGSRARPMILTTLAEKEQLLADLGVDIMGIIRFSAATAQLAPVDFAENILVKQLAAAAVICGTDCGFGRGRSGDLDLLRELGRRRGFIVDALVPRVDCGEKVSSTKIRHALLAGNLDTANRMLGRPYRLSGTVVAGRRIGRELGYRTANVKISDPFKLIPAGGVYAASAKIGGRTYPGMLYIGNRPTFGGGMQRQIEFHAFDTKADFYRQTIEMDLIRYIRPERRFASVPELIRAIGNDERDIRRALKPAPARSRRI